MGPSPDLLVVNLAEIVVFFFFNEFFFNHRTKPQICAISSCFPFEDELIWDRFFSLRQPLPADSPRFTGPILERQINTNCAQLLCASSSIGCFRRLVDSRVRAMCCKAQERPMTAKKNTRESLRQRLQPGWQSSSTGSGTEVASSSSLYLSL